MFPASLRVSAPVLVSIVSACTRPCAFDTKTRSGAENAMPWFSDSGLTKLTWPSTGVPAAICDGSTARTMWSL